jgi:hypothetical protein
MSALAATAPVFHKREPGWIYRKAWDLPLLIFSAALVPMPVTFAYAAQKSGLLTQQQAVDIVNIAVAALVGGPHLFSTATLTLLNRPFLKAHRVYAGLSLALPVAVVYLGITHYRLLINLFFAWASLHVLHQLIYIADCYRARAGYRERFWSRAVDCGVILTGLYPIGLYKLSRGEFQVGGVVLPYPEFARALHLPQIAGLCFFALLAAWIWKSVQESQHGRLNRPKTLLIGITCIVSFLLPMGSNLDVLFQGYNAWHSFQYLFLFWLINRLRYERGEIESPLVRLLVSRASMAPYYLCFLGATAVLVVLTMIVRAVTPLTPDQSYFVVVLSALLMHYYFDHFLFTRPEIVL